LGQSKRKGNGQCGHYCHETELKQRVAGQDTWEEAKNPERKAALKGGRPRAEKEKRRDSHKYGGKEGG